MMSGVMRTSSSSRRFCRITSCPAAKGIRCVNPSIATVMPSFTCAAIASASGMIFCVIVVSLRPIVVIPAAHRRHPRGPSSSSPRRRGSSLSSMRNIVPAANSNDRLIDEKNAGGAEPMERRDFLKSAAAGVGATAAATVVAQSPEAAKQEAPAKPSEGGKPQKGKPATGDIVIERPGSDFMIDVIKTLDLEYMATNPGSSFRSIHESLVNYGGNKAPELLTCMHEEAAIAMAHGYAKAAGKPMGAMIHGTVGLQHGSMAIYNAWVDRVPIF